MGNKKLVCKIIVKSALVILFAAALVKILFL